MSDCMFFLMLIAPISLCGCGESIDKRQRPLATFIQRLPQEVSTEDDYQIWREVMVRITKENESQHVVLPERTLFHPYLNLENDETVYSLNYRLGVLAEDLMSAIGEAPIDHSRLTTDSLEILVEDEDNKHPESATHLSFALPVYSDKGDAYVYLFERQGGNGGEHVVILKNQDGEWLIDTDQLLGIM